MMTRIKDESEVVTDQELRKKIIDEINSPENQARKDEAYRRHKINKDKTSIYVLKELLAQFDDTTVREMGYSISNISIGRKIIDKLARVYSNGCTRIGRTDSETKQIEEVAKTTDMNRVMKQTNRYLRTHKNTMVGVVPCPVYDMNAEMKWDIKVRALQPHLYDVIEQYYDREKPMFVILSNYKAPFPQMTSVEPAKANRGASVIQPRKISDGKDQSIADKKEDEDAEDDTYIWWSKYFHFTTNAKGEFLPMGNEKTPGQVGPQDIVNPILEMNWVNFAIDQEGSFWAEGGDDIYDGSVHVNCMITNTQHIGVTQGYGQFWMKGKGLPKNVKAGVNKSILLEQEDKDDPAPEIGFASANPKLQELKEQVIMYVALLLTTNNLSTKAVAAELSGNTDMASGISMIIDKAESVEDVQDQRDVFYKNEPEIFSLIAAWQQVYKNSLTDDMAKNMLPADVEEQVKFNDAQPIMSEKEKLENLKIRKELGIDSMVDLIMRDNPGMTKEDAEKRLLEIMEAKIKETAAGLNQQPGAEGQPGSQPQGAVEENNDGLYEDENGELWEKTADGGFKKVNADDGQEE